MPASVGDWVMEWVGGRKAGVEGLCNLLGIGSEKGRSQQVCCYRTGYDPGMGVGWISVEIEEVWVCFQSTFCPDRNDPWFSRGTGCSWHREKKKKRTSGRRRQVGEDLWDSQKLGVGGQRMLPFFCRAGDETGEMSLLEQREKRMLEADYLSFWHEWLVG